MVRPACAPVPWNVDQLVPVQEAYLSGFRTESYRIGLEDGFEDVSFKHVLFPIWISAYRFRDQVYRFLINARTGEVQGERPGSAVKITLAVIVAVIVIIVLVVVLRESQ